jgi:hypothetical protein
MAIDPSERYRKLPLPEGETKHKRRTRDKDARIYELEYRVRPEKAMFTFGLWKPGWHRYWKRYRTPEERDEACLRLNRKDMLFEWRVIEKGP